MQPRRRRDAERILFCLLVGGVVMQVGADEGWCANAHALLFAPEFYEQTALVELDGVERDRLIHRNGARELDVFGKTNGEQSLSVLSAIELSIDIESTESA